jgi:tetratricopeptide (TPR) repeat protein
VRGEVDAVDNEIARFEAARIGPVHPLEVSFIGNAAAMMALMRGQFEAAEASARHAEAAARDYHELARNLYAAVMWWTWWQRGELSRPDHELREAVAQAPDVYPAVYATQALAQAEAGESEQAVESLRQLLELDWKDNLWEVSLGLDLAIAAAACGVLRTPPREFSTRIYEWMRQLAGTVIVMRPPAMACAGPADLYLGVLAATMGDLALAEVHFEAALNLARRMRAPTFEVAAEVALARTLRRRRPEAEASRVATLLRHAEESALALGLHRLVQLAIEPG